MTSRAPLEGSRIWRWASLLSGLGVVALVVLSVALALQGRGALSNVLSAIMLLAMALFVGLSFTNGPSKFN